MDEEQQGGELVIPFGPDIHLGSAYHNAKEYAAQHEVPEHAFIILEYSEEKHCFLLKFTWYED